MIQLRPTSTLFPYTTLFRSGRGGGRVRAHHAALLARPQRDRVLPSRARAAVPGRGADRGRERDRKSTRLNSSHLGISYAVFCLKKKTISKAYSSSNRYRLSY